MSKLDKARAGLDRIVNIWNDRDVHWSSFKAVLREMPSRFRNADPSQRRNVLMAVAIIVVLQILLLSSL
jgi:hypothetical protein